MYELTSLVLLKAWHHPTRATQLEPRSQSENRMVREGRNTTKV